MLTGGDFAAETVAGSGGIAAAKIDKFDCEEVPIALLL